MNDISGLPKGPNPTGPIPSGPMPEDYEHPPLTKEVVSIDQMESFDYMGYQGTDTMAAAGITLLQFGPKTIYEASIQIPELLPPDPEGLSGPQPYGSAEQKLIKQNISKQAVERLKKSGLPIESQKEVYEAILSGKPLKDPKLAKRAKEISDEVSDSIRKGAHLPASWTILSTSPLDWTPIPVEPYDTDKRTEIETSYHSAFDKALKSYAGKLTPQLTPEQMEMIVNAYATGKVPSMIADHFEAVSKIATEEVQKKFGLPTTWYKGTTNLDDLKPVNLGIVTPAAVNKARSDFILGNVDELMNAIGASLQKALDKLSPDAPAALALKDYVAAISQAIQELKGMLYEMQVKDAERSKDLEAGRANLTEARFKALEENVKKQNEMREAQEKQARWGFIMKIIGPIIAALATVVGALLCWTGAGTALLVAGIAIGIALTAYSVADSITGCTGKIVEAFNKWMADLFPDNEVLQKAIKFLVMALVVIVLIVAVVFTGGSAAVTIAAGAAQFARAVVMECIRQLSLQLIVMVIMSSNAIPELLGAVLKEHGVNKKDKQIAEIVMMAITMVIAMIAVAKGGKVPAESASIGFVATVKQIGNQIVTAVEELIKTIKEGTKAMIEAIIKLINELVNKLLTLAKDIPAAIKGAYEEIASAGRALLNAINEGRGVEFIGAALTRFAEALKEFAVMTKSAAAAAFEKVLEESIEILKKIGGKIGEKLTDIGKGFDEFRKDLGTIPALLIGKIKHIYLKSIVNKTAEQAKEFAELSEFFSSAKFDAAAIKGMSGASKTLQLTGGTIEMVGGIAQFALGYQVYELLLQVGEIKKSEELIQAMIQELNRLLQSITSAMDSNDQALKGLNQFYTTFLESQSEMGTKIARSYQG